MPTRAPIKLKVLNRHGKTIFQIFDIIKYIIIFSYETPYDERIV